MRNKGKILYANIRLILLPFQFSSLISERGQALITLLFFIIISITVTSAAVIMVMVNSLSGMKFQQGEIAYEIAQSGADNAVLRLLRNPAYTGEIVAVGSGTATIEVTGSGTSGSPFVITSTGVIGNFTRKIQITATYTNNLLVASDPKEVY